MICPPHARQYREATNCIHRGREAEYPFTIEFPDGYRIDIDREGIETYIPLED